MEKGTSTQQQAGSAASAVDQARPQDVGQRKNLSFRECVGFGLGDFASQLGYGTFSWFIVLYYTQVAGINSGFAAAVTVIAMAIGGVADIGAGIALDKTQTRFGKARPWILRMMLPFAVIIALVFSVPDTGGTGKEIWVLATLTLFCVIYSFINTPYGVLNSLITDDRLQRSRLNLFRTFMSYGGAVAVACLTPFVVSGFGGDLGGWSRMGIAYGALSLILFSVLLAWTRERVKIPASSRPKASLGSSFRSLVRSDSWVRVSVFGALFFTLYVSSCAGTVMYGTYVMEGSDSLRSTLNLVVSLCFYIPVMVGAVLLGKPIARFGKRNVCLSGLVIIIVSSLIFLIDPRSYALLIVVSIIKGFGFAPIMGCFFAMAIDTIEYGEWKTGLRNEGLTYSTTSAATKVGSGLGTGVVGLALAVGGYSAGEAAQPESVGVAVWFVYVILPIILCLVMIPLLLRYRVDAIYQDIESDLRERRQPVEQGD